MYDDFAVLEPSKFGDVAKEYKKCCQSKTLSINIKAQNHDVADKIEYLRQLIERLIAETKNLDKKLVLEQILIDVINQQTKLLNLLPLQATALGESEPETISFCNNLKLAIQVTSEITSLLIKIKDEETTPGEIRPKFTEIILKFLEINNKLVSLFGDCRYRMFQKKIK